MMKRPTETIANLLTATAGANDFDTYVSIAGIDTVVIASADVLHYFWEHYYEWSMFTKGDTIQAKYSWLKYCYNEYCKEMRLHLNRIYEVITKNYDPSTDYMRHEEQSYKNTHELEYGRTATNTATNYETETEYNSTITDDTTTYDSSSYRPATQRTRGGSDTTTINGEMETAWSGTDTTTDTREKADNQRDVTGYNNSPVTYIDEEIKFRISNDFTDIVMKGFADKYLFLLADERCDEV